MISKIRRAACGRSVALAAIALGLGFSLLSAGGCAAGYRRVRPTVLDVAQTEAPESQLVDVGVAVSDVPELTEKQLRKQGTSEAIRRSESYYLPYHLKSTLQQSSHWGTVQVIPPEDEFTDLAIRTELVESNGEVTKVAVEAVDASGRVWLRRKYMAVMKAANYENTQPGEYESCQDFFNTVANDLAAFKRTLSPADIEEIRTVAKLRFAKEFAPVAFGDYLVQEGDGRIALQRLPSADDPLMERIDRIQGREQMFVDTLNQYYEGYYLRMWEPYENWRKYYLVEQEAKRRAEREAILRTVGGILMVAAAVALQTSDSPNLRSTSGGLMVAGGQVFVSGINVSEQVSIHEAAIQELAESFGAEMEPTVVELEGKQYELTGTAEEQYVKWKDLLRHIYYEETGFGTDAMTGESGFPLDGNAFPTAP